MGKSDWTAEKAIKPAVEVQGTETSDYLYKAKTVIADKLQHVAAAINEKAADRDPQCGLARYGKQASEWLDQSAGYVREFNYEEADAKVRDYVRQSPGRSIAIAAAVGVVIGAILRRR